LGMKRGGEGENKEKKEALGPEVRRLECTRESKMGDEWHCQHIYLVVES